MSTTLEPKTPQGPVPSINIPDSWDYPRLVYVAPYFTTVPLAELIEPTVLESIEAQLPGLVPPYVNDAANAAVAAQAVMLTGSSMSGPLYLNPVMPVQPNQAASMAYVDTMIATAGVPEVPPVPSGQVWARQTGQWIPIDPAGGNFLPITGGAMQGAINMQGNAITNLPAVPQGSGGAASAGWVLQQIAANSLYQGTYLPETNVPDLTQPGTHVNAYTWIVTTPNTSGVIISAPVPGLQGLTVFNGDNLVFSSTAGVFQIVRGGGLSLGEAEALFVPLVGGQMTGALNLYANATSPMNAVPLQQVEALVTGAGIPEAPTNGQIYGRQGLTTSWQPVLPIGGGILTGSLSLAGNATTAMQAIPLQQLTSTLGNYVPLAGNVTVLGPITMSGAGANLTLNSNAAAALQAVPLQQLTATLGAYVPIAGGTITGTLNVDGGVGIGTSGLFSLIDTGTIRALNWHSQWADVWTLATGVRSWLGPAGMLLELDASGNLGVTGTVTAPEYYVTGSQYRWALSGGNPILQFAIGWYWAYQSNGSLTWVNAANGTGAWNVEFEGSTGLCHNADGLWHVNSDVRLKQDIEDYTVGLTEIRQLRPRSFRKISEVEIAGTRTRDDAEPLPPARTLYGLIAQECETVMPECVTQRAITLGDVEYTDLRSFNSGPVMWALVNAVKELDTRLTALEARGTA